MSSQLRHKQFSEAVSLMASLSWSAGDFSSLGLSFAVSAQKLELYLPCSATYFPQLVPHWDQRAGGQTEKSQGGVSHPPVTTAPLIRQEGSSPTNTQDLCSSLHLQHHKDASLWWRASLVVSVPHSWLLPGVRLSWQQARPQWKVTNAFIYHQLGGTSRSGLLP